MVFRVLILIILVIVVPLKAIAEEGDAKKGKRVFNKCKSCHYIDKEKNKTGPNLVSIIGRKAASIEDFKYSEAMQEKAEEGLVWDEENLRAFLAKPKDFMPKTKMTFVGLKKEKDLNNLIAYLKSVQE